MVAATKIQTDNSSTSDNKNKWYTEDELSNQVIKAYDMGKEQVRKESKNKFESQLQAAQLIAKNIYFNLRKNKVLCKEVRLRQTNRHFESIFIIPEKDYLSPLQYALSYEVANLLSEKMNDSKTCFSFLFMPKVRSIDQAALIADGFFWTFKETAPTNKS